MPKFRRSYTPFQRYLRVITTALEEHYKGRPIPPDVPDLTGLWSSKETYGENVMGVAAQLHIVPEVQRIHAGYGLGFLTAKALDAYDKELERQEREKYIESIDNPGSVAEDLELVFKENIDGELKDSIYKRVRTVRKMAYDRKLADADPVAFNLANKFLREVETRESEQRMADAAAERVTTDYAALQLSIAGVRAKLEQLVKPLEPAPPSIGIDVDKLIAGFRTETAKLGKRFEGLEKAVKAAPDREMVRHEVVRSAGVEIDIQWKPTVCPSCAGSVMLKELHRRKALELGKKPEELTHDEIEAAETKPLKSEMPEFEVLMYQAERMPVKELKVGRLPVLPEVSFGGLTPTDEARLRFLLDEFHRRELNAEETFELRGLRERQRQLYGMVAPTPVVEVAEEITITPEAVRVVRKELTPSQKNKAEAWSLARVRARTRDSIENMMRTDPAFAHSIRMRDFELEAALRSLPGFIRDKDYYDLCDEHVQAIYPTQYRTYNILLLTGYMLSEEAGKGQLKESNFTQLGVPQKFLADARAAWKEQGP